MISKQAWASGVFAVMIVFVASHVAEQLLTPALGLSTSQKNIPSNTFTTRDLIAPNNLSSSSQGHEISLSWTAGQNGSGYRVLGVNNGASSNCNGVTFSGVGSTTSISYTDSGRYTPQGNWFCYQIKTTYGIWSSLQNNPVNAVQLGFVANSVQLVNNGDSSGCDGQQSAVAGDLDCGDQILLTLNQAADTTTGPSGSDTVCANPNSNTLWLGSTTPNGSCTMSETLTLGKLTGGTIGGCECRFNASYTWGNGNKAVTVTVGARIAGSSYPTMTNSVWTFIPTADSMKMLSSIGGFHICDNNSNGGNCLPSSSSASQLSAAYRSPTKKMSNTLATTVNGTVTPTATPTLSRTQTPTRAASPTLTATPSVASPNLTATPMQMTVSPTLVATRTIVTPTVTASPSPTLALTATSIATRMPTPQATPNPMTTVSTTPVATVRPTFTATPTPR